MKFLPLICPLLLSVSVLIAQEENDTATAPTPQPPAALQGDDAIPPAGNINVESAGKGEGEGLDFLVRSNFIFSKLLQNTRAMDPFGQQMDPANAKETPMLAEHYTDSEETTATLDNSSLKSALLTLPVTGVYPQRNVIVIGARSFAPGGQFGMKFQDLTIRLRFEGVRGKEIFFKDMETREVTSIEFAPHPKEFEPLTNSGQPLGSGIVSMNDLFIAN